MLEIESIDHIVLNVRDVEISATWYVRVLGMAREDRSTEQGDVRTSVRFGQNKINLRPLSATQEGWFTGWKPQSGAYDLCFLTKLSSQTVADHLAKSGVAIELGPVTKLGALGLLRSVYVRDPDGNLIEISRYDGVHQSQ